MAVGAPISGSGVALKAESQSRGPSRGALIGFLVVAVQFALLVLLITRFDLESRAFQDVAQIAFAGFLVHHFLPGKWRMSFFLVLSLGVTAYVLGLDQRQWQAGLALSRFVPLFAIGLALIGICHLPVRLITKVFLLIAVGLLLAWMRQHWAAWFGGGVHATWIWPVLGAMFMFRLMIYLYDLQHEKGPVQPVRTLSYFFLLPNVCFTLFPVIDYKTFCRSYYSDEALRIYQRGLDWITRGIIHLLLWRIVYYEFYIDPSRVADGADLAQYIVSNMGLYLRVSGQFHLVVGLLLLFGFNLPETNRRYFLAAGFTDYWRRVNIYWKDFIMKLFYYPVVFRLKAWGPKWSMVAATVVAFFATWFLHSYQTFWVRNSFAIKSQDFLFWGCLCALVIFNSLRELKRGRKRSLGGTAVTWQANVGLAATTAGTFLLLSTLWSIWSCDSMEQWLGLWEVADIDTLRWCAAALAVIFAATLVLECPWRTAKGAQRAFGGETEAPSHAFPVRQAVWTCMLPAALLLLVSVQRLHVHVGPTASHILGNLFNTKPNKSDEENMVRGYYEDLMDVGRANPILDAGGGAQPRDWGMLEKTPVYREINDYRMYELAPSSSIVLNGHRLSTNRWGMRDREYEMVKAPGTYRIAILGSSSVMGLNVGDGESFEALLEERLNRERIGKPHSRYEILNFGVNGYNPPSQTVVLEKKVLAFKPDAVFLVFNLQESYFTVQRFAKSLRRGVEPIDEIFFQVARESKVDARTPELRAEKRLSPYAPRLIEWAFQRIGERCRQEGIRAVLVYQPAIGAGKLRQKEADMILQMARDAGFSVIDLEGTFGNAEPETLKVAPWDAHPNAMGHKLIADGLYSALTAGAGGIFNAGGLTSDPTKQLHGAKGR